MPPMGLNQTPKTYQQKQKQKISNVHSYHPSQEVASWCYVGMDSFQNAKLRNAKGFLPSTPLLNSIHGRQAMEEDPPGASISPNSPNRGKMPVKIQSCLPLILGQIGERGFGETLFVEKIDEKTASGEGKLRFLL